MSYNSFGFFLSLLNNEQNQLIQMICGFNVHIVGYNLKGKSSLSQAWTPHAQEFM
jgi:hypothetical protein